MKRCTFFANCQADGLVYFLKKSEAMRDVEFNIQHNWQVIMGEQSVEGLFAAAKDCSLFIFQPTNRFQRHGTSELGPSTDDLIRDYVPRDAKKISFSYAYNTGFFPLIKVGNGPDGWITGRWVKEQAAAGNYADLIECYDSHQLRFDCAQRFAECLQEQARREETTDLKLAPFILQQFNKQRLFLTHNHPTGAMFAELANQILAMGCLEQTPTGALRRIHPHEAPQYVKADPAIENEAKMNGVFPESAIAAYELGRTNFTASDGFQYYREQLYQFIDDHKKARIK